MIFILKFGYFMRHLSAREYGIVYTLNSFEFMVSFGRDYYCYFKKKYFSVQIFCLGNKRDKFARRTGISRVSRFKNALKICRN